MTAPASAPGGLGTVERLRRAWATNPRGAMAVRAAIAAGLAWWAALLLPDPASEFPYYAPMGAVIATSTTLAGSVRESLQAVGAIALGGVIGWAASVSGESTNPVVIAVAVALGVLLAGWRQLGAMGSWVPTAALFTLVIGHGEAFYVGAYAGLTLLGAAVGVAVTVVSPALPLAPAQDALARLRQGLAGQLNDLAEALDQDGAPTAEEWDASQRELRPDLRRMHGAVEEAEEGVRGNRRARRYAAELDALRRQRAAFGRVVTLLTDLVDLLSTQERADQDHVAFGPDLRPLAGRVLRRLADALDSVSGTSADPETTRAAREELGALVQAAEDTRRSDVPGGGLLAASGFVMIVGRALDAVDPDLAGR